MCFQAIFASFGRATVRVMCGSRSGEGCGPVGLSVSVLARCTLETLFSANQTERGLLVEAIEQATSLVGWRHRGGSSARSGPATQFQLGCSRGFVNFFGAALATSRTKPPAAGRPCAQHFCRAALTLTVPDAQMAKIIVIPYTFVRAAAHTPASWTLDLPHAGKCRICSPVRSKLKLQQKGTIDIYSL